MAKSAYAFAQANPAKVKTLQRALRAAGATDARGLLPVEDGVLGPSTVAAVNTWNALSRGTTAPALTREQVAANLDGLTRSIVQNNAPAAAKRPPAPAAATPATPYPATLRQGAKRQGAFKCLSGVCKPASAAAKAQAMALQKALNQMPASVRMKYPGSGGGMVTVDGAIGPMTAGAYGVVLRAAALRQNVPAPIDMPRRDSSWLAANLDMAIADVTAELSARTRPAQVPAPPAAAQADLNRPVFQMTTTGSATGNRPWKCLALALQIQLNRLGQRLGVDGTIGPNTQASVNKVLKQKWSVRDIARELSVTVSLVQKAADAKGAPAPPAAAHRLAAEKCALETASPAIDSRYFAAGPIAVSTPAPSATPTAPSAQPLPIPPSEKIRQLQALLNDFPPAIIALYPGGKPVVVTGVLVEGDVGAIRAVVRASAARQGITLTEGDLLSITVAVVNAKPDTPLGLLQKELPLLRQMYQTPAATQVAPSPLEPAVRTVPPPTIGADVGQSKGGLVYQITPAGIVGYGPNAGAFTQRVRALQQQLNRLADVRGGNLAGPIGLYQLGDGTIVLGRVRKRTKAARARTSPAAGRGRAPASTTGRGLATGVIDAPTVAAFNQLVTPELTDPKPYTAADLAADIEHAVDVAREVADRSSRPAPALPAPAVPLEPYTPAPESMTSTSELSPDTAEQIIAQGVTRGLSVEEARAIVTAAMQSGQDAAAATNMIDNALSTRKATDAASSDMRLAPTFPLWGKIAIGFTAAVGVGLIGYGIASGRRAQAHVAAA